VPKWPFFFFAKPAHTHKQLSYLWTWALFAKIVKKTGFFLKTQVAQLTDHLRSPDSPFKKHPSANHRWHWPVSHVRSPDIQPNNHGVSHDRDIGRLKAWLQPIKRKQIIFKKFYWLDGSNSGCWLARFPEFQSLHFFEVSSVQALLTVASVNLVVHCFYYYYYYYYYYYLLMFVMLLLISKYIRRKWKMCESKSPGGSSLQFVLSTSVSTLAGLHFLFW